MVNSSSVDDKANNSVADTLVLHNRLDDLVTLSEWINQLAAQIGFSQRGIFRLDLVLAEAVTNIIEHAFTDESLHNITVNVACDKNKAVISVIDDGQKFDPLQMPEVNQPQNLQEVQIGGLGVHLIREYTDRCTYQRVNDKNILTLEFNDNDKD